PGLECPLEQLFAKIERGTRGAGSTDRFWRAGGVSPPLAPQRGAHAPRSPGAANIQRHTRWSTRGAGVPLALDGPRPRRYISPPRSGLIRSDPRGCRAMRHGLGLVLALTAALGAGCATPKAAPPASWLQRLRPFQGPDAEDAVQMDVALIEVPLGDRSVNDGLWALIAEQLDQETKGVLEENGLRVGQVSAPPPPEL